MPVAKAHPIDLWLWQKAKNAPKSELWKWSWDIWDTVFYLVFYGEATAQDMRCPVCGARRLYVYFLAFRLSLSESTESRRVYVGDRWIGCHACDIQVSVRAQDIAKAFEHLSYFVEGSGHR